MKANNSLRINMPRALELISFFFLGHGPTYPISDLSGSTITSGNCNADHKFLVFFSEHLVNAGAGVTFKPILFSVDPENFTTTTRNVERYINKNKKINFCFRVTR